MSDQKHPGTITFFNEEKGTQWSKSADELPEESRFHDGVPVMQVVYTASGNIFSTFEYGPNNKLLRHSTGFRTPPAEPTRPGTVIYIDEGKGTRWSKAAEELPKRSRFCGDVPIVKVVFTAGEKLSIQEYGPNGELLRTTDGVR